MTKLVTLAGVLATFLAACAPAQADPPAGPRPPTPVVAEPRYVG
jgi:hypothetical protein